MTQAMTQSMPIITISRELGSDGNKIAQAVAAKLSATALDKQVLSEMAHQAGVSVETISQAEERLLTKQVAVSDEMRAMVGAQRGTVGAMNEGQFLQLLTAAIKALAQPGNVVFVGRGAQIILKEQPMALHVHLYAPPSVRAARLQQRRALPSVETALQIIQQADEQRKNWFRRFFNGMDWKSPRHYHLMIDTARIPLDSAATLILEAVRTVPSTSLN